MSHWLESLRKDVECTFGILKGRWHILKSGTRLQGVKVSNKIWKTCCALHNWLLEVDVMDDDWTRSDSMHVNCRTICQLSLNTFRSKLVDHFDIMFK